MAKHSKEQSDSLVALLPKEPIHRVVRPVQRFLHIQAASGVVLLLAAIVALIFANSPYAKEYLDFWKTPIGLDWGDHSLKHPLYHWINDGLMAIFFFVVGLEVKREIVLGELRHIRTAALPITAAIGGMLLPAGIFLMIQYGQPGQQGWGIPMATDIAFVVGCMALLGSRVPHGLRVMLLSLAIVDDIGAILVIALGYSSGISWAWLGVGLAMIVAVRIVAQLGVRGFAVYTALGAVVWFAFHESGVHATIAGVILGLMTPAKPYMGKSSFSNLLGWLEVHLQGEWDPADPPVSRVRKLQHAVRETIPPVEYLQEVLHPWVSFLIMPVFALANAGVIVSWDDLVSPLSLAVMAGLIVGKPLGVMLFSLICIKLKITQLPHRVTWLIMLGGGFLAGIGFTMALFIAGLAVSADLLDQAKVGVLAGSTISAVLGMTLLYLVLPTAGKQAPRPTAPAPPN